MKKLLRSTVPRAQSLLIAESAKQIHSAIKAWRLIDHALKRLRSYLSCYQTATYNWQDGYYYGTAARSGSPQIMPCIRLVYILVVVNI